MKYVPILLLSFLLTTSTYYHEKTKTRLKQSNAREAEAIEAFQAANELLKESKAIGEEAMAGWRQCAETTKKRRLELEELRRLLDTRNSTLEIP